MNLLAEQIKASVTMLDIYDKYGIQADSKHFIRCPFHTEKTASLGLYANNMRWKCFGCGAGGSVIDFVMRYFGIGFSQAVVKIGYDFGMSTDKPSRKVINTLAEQRRAEEKERQAYRNVYDRKCAEKRYYHCLVQCAEIPKENDVLSDEIAQELAHAQAMLCFLDYWFQVNQWR